MFQREALPSDKFVGPYENDNVARVANNGAYPPDLSLIVKARAGGADYLYSLLNGYKEYPEDYEASEGMYYNTFYPGNQIAMPSPIEDDIVEYDDGTEATHTQIAKDVTAFLNIMYYLIRNRILSQPYMCLLKNLSHHHHGHRKCLLQVHLASLLQHER